MWSVFFALLRRDLRVARKELPFFLVRTTMQPLLFLVVFGYLLPKMGFVGKGYSRPAARNPRRQSELVGDPVGRVADGCGLRVDQGNRGPAARAGADARDRRREDRVGDAAGLDRRAFVLPIARLIMGPIPALTLSHGGEVFVIVLLGSLAFSSLGLWLGTAIAPQQIGLMFSVIIAPMIFFGCAYYPWRGLDVVPVMKYLVLVNPLVYVAEGMRGALTPAVPHMPLAVVIVALLVISAFFWTLGTRSFFKRAIG